MVDLSWNSRNEKKKHVMLCKEENRWKCFPTFPIWILRIFQHTPGTYPRPFNRPPRQWLHPRVHKHGWLENHLLFLNRRYKQWESPCACRSRFWYLAWHLHCHLQIGWFSIVILVLEGVYLQWLYHFINKSMGPYQQKPLSCDRAIRYSGLGVHSVGPLGDFLES